MGRGGPGGDTQGYKLIPKVLSPARVLGLQRGEEEQGGAGGAQEHLQLPQHSPQVPQLLAHPISSQGQPGQELERADSWAVVCLSWKSRKTKRGGGREEAQCHGAITSNEKK